MYLESERLVIRNFNAQDIELIFEINNHPECIRFNSWESMSLDVCREVLEKWMSGYSKYQNYGVFCVELKEMQSIGMAFIMKYDETDNYEIGFRLRRDVWGNGYATEIANMLIEYSKENLNAKYVCAEVDSHNERSLSIFRRLGFAEYNHPSGKGGRMFKYDVIRDSI